MNRPLTILFILALAVVAFAIRQFWPHSTPQYGYALFGSPPTVGHVTKHVSFTTSNNAATPTTRANFIVHGRDVFFDANDDAIAQKHEKFSGDSNSFEVISADKKTQYRLVKAVIGLSPESISDSLPQHIILNVDVYDTSQPDKLQFQQAGKIDVFPSAKDRGWAHFDGPMAFQFFDTELRLPGSGGPSVDLRVAISTLPATPPDSDNPQSVSNLTTTVPGKLVPTATIEFPSASSPAPIVKRYDMKQFC